MQNTAKESNHTEIVIKIFLKICDRTKDDFFTA